MEKITGLYDLRIPLVGNVDTDELIARAIRDCFIRHDGSIDKLLMDKTIIAVGKNTPKYKTVWKNFKKTFEVKVKDGSYINPYIIF